MGTLALAVTRRANRARRPMAASALACVAMLHVVPTADAEEIRQLHTFYFGNSFTGNTMPGLQPL